MASLRSLPGRCVSWFRRQPRWSRTTAKVLAALVAVSSLTAGSAGAALFVDGSGSPSSSARSSGHDALWLGHDWVGWEAGTGKVAKTDADLTALVAMLRDTGIKDLFVHDGPFGMDGTLDPAESPNAAWFIAGIHSALPGVRVQAWLGQDVGDSALHLDSAATRSAIVSGVSSALALGFDGVHLDFEPVADGDADFLALLDATHTVTSLHHALLSVSVPQIEPVDGLRLPGNWLAGHPKWWSQGYFHSVAERADQVALMAYDTSLPTAWAYRGYVVRESAMALAAVPPNVDLLIGVPAFHTSDPGHSDSAETMSAALRGVRLALGSRSPKSRFGVALYVDFAATAGDWDAYRTDWLAPGS